jgi:hypothetical protein
MEQEHGVCSKQLQPTLQRARCGVLGAPRVSATKQEKGSHHTHAENEPQQCCNVAPSTSSLGPLFLQFRTCMESIPHSVQFTPVIFRGQQALRQLLHVWRGRSLRQRALQQTGGGSNGWVVGGCGRCDDRAGVGLEYWCMKCVWILMGVMG